MTRKLKALGLALVAVCAVAVMAAPAANGLELTAAEYPATLDGSGIAGKQTNFNLGGREFICQQTGLSGTLEKASSTVLINREYSGCTAKLLGITYLVTITTNGCAFELHIHTKQSGDLFKSRVDIVCEGSAGIEIYAYTNQAEDNAGKPSCVYELTPQQLGLEFVQLENNTMTGQITVAANVEKIAYKVLSGKPLLCGASGNNGIYTGSTTVTGTNKEKTPIGLELK